MAAQGEQGIILCLDTDILDKGRFHPKYATTPHLFL